MKHPESKELENGDPLIWQQNGSLRNGTNNEIKKILDTLPTTWRLIRKVQKQRGTWINKFNSRNASSYKNISEIKVGEEIAEDIAETFNNHFAGVGKKLAFDIPVSAVEPDAYVLPAETTFSIKSPNINAVNRKLKTLNIGKAAGLDEIPCKLLKIVAEIFVLTQIFNKIMHKHIP